jgi:hypothetical protein
MGHLNDHRAEHLFTDVTITDDIDAAPDLAEDQHLCQAAAGFPYRYHIAYRDRRRSMIGGTHPVGRGVLPVKRSARRRLPCRRSEGNQAALARPRP